MGREVKRVPMNFDWPINKIWHGYAISTCTGECEDCRKFAKIQGMKMTSYDCPIFDQLEPPYGEGWQMWETTSEGSPMSPVFESPEDLAKWLADNNASAFGPQTASYESWLGMINKGWALSAISNADGLRSGVEVVGEL